MKKIVTLFSGSASTIRYLIENDPNYGNRYTFIGAFTDRNDASAIPLFKDKHIPVDVLDRREWVQEHFPDKKGWREPYFREVAKRIEAIGKPDLIVLSGFMLLVPKFFCDDFFVINVHPADLRITHEVDGTIVRKYTGDDAVTLAINAGEAETRSTIHQVTDPGQKMEHVDGGPIITVSEPLPVISGRNPKEHQEEMKWKCDGPAMQKAIEMIVSGEYKKQ